MEEQFFDICWKKQWNAVVAATIMILFGCLVLSKEREYRPGVIRPTLFGIDTSYFMVYYSGLLLYLCIVFLTEDS
ncbi:unnamed protein product [Orchesella dallaii]|uniref:Uncharacterized protein n=1 Tax=Orchesella dallaii TaxID=48710 RepID=A0ABP1SA47_9HEXA